MKPDDRISPKPLGSDGSSPYSSEPDRLDSLPSLAGGGDDGSGLSSLAQSARQKQLKSARTTLIVVGCLTVVVNFVLFFVMKAQLDVEIRKAGLNPNNLPAEVQAAIAIDYGVTGLFVLLGFVFLILGALVQRYPVPCTVGGLVLFILGWVVSALVALAFNPTQILAGVIWKVIIVASLGKAVQSAIAYQREASQPLAEFE